MHGAAQACAKFVARATEEMGAINIYEIYADVCRDWRADADGRQLLRALAGPGTHLRQGAGLARVAVAPILPALVTRIVSFALVSSWGPEGQGCSGKDRDSALPVGLGLEKRLLCGSHGWAIVTHRLGSIRGRSMV